MGIVTPMTLVTLLQMKAVAAVAVAVATNFSNKKPIKRLQSAPSL